MVSENVAYQLQNFEEAEIDESPVKWCSVTLSDIIARGKRLEASVYDVEAKQAREIVIHGKFPAIALGGDDGLTSSYTGARFKRIWVDHSEYPIYQPSSIVDIKPTPDGYISKRTDTDIDALRVKKGQILMTCSGTIGKVAYVSDTLDGLIFSHDLLRIDSNDDNAGYIYAYLKSKIGQQILLTNRVDEGMNPRVLEKDQLIKLCNILAEEILIGKYDTEIGTYRIENNISDGRDSSITDDHLIAYRLCKEEIMYNWVQYLRLLIKNHFAFAGTMYNEDNLFQQRIPDQLWENIRTFIINLKNLPVWKDRSMAATIFGGKNKYDFWKIIFQTGKTSDGTQVLVVPLNVADMIKK